MNLDFDKTQGLIPAIIQDARTRKVLMLGYMNQAALAKTQAEKIVTFYSRSKQRLWTKGETSHNFLEVVDIQADCDNDTLLILVNPRGPVCHTGSDTCFDEKNEGDFFSQLEAIIQNYKQNPQEGSYTSSLFKKGINKIAQKVGEEAIEVVIESKDQNMDLFKNECADLLYHLLVLLTEKGTSFSEVVEVLQSRHQAK
ncbi:MAG: bifunctional phosphoribosyl-AMP cyclohydrolase/phosphoribosyl-ATP diphosphatase HisIE [Microscillaceae bacterium]|jgi:phosphoribosyl-ATP pyrophosphohydrolase/phosphoribosyl-AMP cyclohydrolase|nr:bifunctional phosphoribosyl-AMP cyclohydrolase/phosphoribosyl-ATP diphosphatase HisIE [Microscillaceae bacterium]